MSAYVYVQKARLSFPHIVEPQQQVNEQTGVARTSYNCELIFEPEHPGYIAFIKAYAELASAKWGLDGSKVMAVILKDRKFRCFGLGDDKINKKTFQPYDGYAGNTYITMGRDTAPQLIQHNGQPVPADNHIQYQTVARTLYGGCYVNAAIKPWLQDNKHGRGVRAELVALQFAGDGSPFGEGSQDVSHMFGAVKLDPPESSTSYTTSRDDYLAAKGY
jgi:hypothetical protein